MKTDTEILNELAQNTQVLRLLTVEECSLLKSTMLMMHRDIVSLCDKYGITIMLGGGSCLGAVRHKGFIPWDDDLDMMMPRCDYEKLIEIYEKGLIDDKYLFMYPNNNNDVKNNYLKIYLKGTTCKEVFDDENSFPAHVYLDVFPMDFAPNSFALRMIKAFASDLLQAICTCTLYSQYRSANMEMFVRQDKDALVRYKIRLFLGHFFSFMSHKKWVYCFDRFNANSRKSKFITIPTGRNHYLKEAMPLEVFLPVKEASFENEKSYIPRDYDTYLKHLYGDYMQLPPVNKRERHFVVDFRL